MKRRLVRARNSCAARGRHLYGIEALEGRTFLSATVYETITVPNATRIVMDGPTPGTSYATVAPGQIRVFDDTAPVQHDDGNVGGSGTGAAGYQIVIHFPDASLTPSQQAVFNTAADRWESIILGELSDITLNWGEGSQTVDDIHIDATAPFIDGVGGILGQAGPDFIRGSNDLTINGIMEFDSADVADLEADGELDEVILHEMGHVLGLGTLWDPAFRNLITGAGGSNPRYTGALATAQYQAIFGVATTTVPVENTGGAGTADGHWREAGGAGVAFDRELMTGFLDSGVVNPLSRVSIAQFADLGYPSVNINAFDVFNPTNGGNAYPTIASLSDSPDPVPTNSSFTLTANSVADTGGGTISTVRFYRETNNIPGLQILVGTVGDIQGDLLLGQDTSSAGGYTFNVSTTGLANGVYTYYAQATDNQNLVSVNVQTTHTVSSATPSATPGVPDLVGATDTGVSNSDNITNRDNSGAAVNLQFTVSGTVSGATVTIYADGVAIGSAVASGTSTTVTTNGTTDLADGSRSITAKQLEPGKTLSPDSAALAVTIDTTAPTADVVNISPDPRVNGITTADVAFNEAITGFTFNDLTLTRTSVNVALSAANNPTNTSGNTWTVPNLEALTSISGTYQLAIAGGSVNDVAGNALAAAASDTWVHSLPAWLTAGSAASWNSLTKALTVTGAATINANPGSDAPLITASGVAAVLTIAPPAGSRVDIGSVTLSSNASATVIATGATRTPVIAGSFSVTSGAKFDLTDNSMVFQNAALSSVQGVITQGFNNGDWAGSGLRSSTAATDPNGYTALGYLSNADLGATTFAGVAVDGNDILVKYTYYGDADLSGAVTLDDYSQFLFGFQNPVAAQWSVGDFDYSGSINLDDFSAFLLVFQNQGGPLV